MQAHNVFFLDFVLSFYFFIKVAQIFLIVLESYLRLIGNFKINQINYQINL